VQRTLRRYRPSAGLSTLLDEHLYPASESTFHRLLRDAHGDVRERHAQATQSAKVEPELIAPEPNQVWSWDITELHGPAKRTRFYLSMIIDIHSRKTFG